MEQQTKKTVRVRSPNYPNYSLGECMIFLEKLYKKYGANEVHKEDAITQMGHSPTSSTAGRVLASMFSFGLLESRGAKDSKFVRLSRLAQEILLEEDNSPQRFSLLRQAALSDEAMIEIWNKWEANIPHEDSIKKSLQLEMNYSPEGAKRFASVIAATYNYAQLSKVPQEEQEDVTIEEEVSLKAREKSSEQEISSIRKANLPLPGIGVDREIIISVPDDLTDEEFEQARKWFEFLKFGFVSNSVGKDKNDDKQEQ